LAGSDKAICLGHASRRRTPGCTERTSERKSERLKLMQSVLAWYGDVRGPRLDAGHPIDSGVNWVRRVGKARSGEHAARHGLLALFLLCLLLAPRSLRAAARPVAATAGEADRLRVLSGALRYAPSKRAARAAYKRLEAFARRARPPLANRAALALGHADYSDRRYGQARRWFVRAQADPVLRQYGVFWEAESELADQQNDPALALLESFRRDFPDSVLTEQALESLGEAALEAGKPERALAALSAYPRTSLRPKLLFLEGQAQEKTGALADAASSYLGVYDRFPLSDVAEQAGERVRALAQQMGAQFPAPAMSDRMTRAEILYLAHRWQEARDAYDDLLPQLTGSDRERAELRVAECASQLGGDPSMLAGLVLSDPVLDAERLAALAAAYRTRQNEPGMLDAVEKAVARDPVGLWASQALFDAGNYYWVNLNRSRAAEFYRRAAEKSAGGKLAAAADWRAAWVAYLTGQAEAAQLLERHIEKFPGSPFVPDALYWLGRGAEQAKDPARARAYYEEAVARFPQSYFGLLAARRLAAIGRAPAAAINLPLPPAPAGPLPTFSESIPAAAAERWARAQALESVAFDASAELELRAAYEATGTPRLLLEAARAAENARHYMAGAKMARALVPDIESRRIEDVPAEIWRLVYPFPFTSEVEEAARRTNVDPMLLVGLVRQESGFDPGAVSSAGAVGLMQLLPKTARKEARRLRLRYSRQRLVEPRYNLRLGAEHLAVLLKKLGGPEKALAAYNAGRDRVAAWRGGGPYDEPAEFVESIPFSETREYVEIVMRNAELYRRLYRASR
jgi:soluble lytic murein transglycosylase